MWSSAVSETSEDIRDFLGDFYDRGSIVGDICNFSCRNDITRQKYYLLYWFLKSMKQKCEVWHVMLSLKVIHFTALRPYQSSQQCIASSHPKMQENMFHKFRLKARQNGVCLEKQTTQKNVLLCAAYFASQSL